MVIVLSETAACKKPSQALENSPWRDKGIKDLLGEKPAREEEFPAYKKELYVITHKSK